jgi:hypothetical protein
LFPVLPDKPDAGGDATAASRPISRNWRLSDPAADAAHARPFREFLNIPAEI